MISTFYKILVGVVIALILYRILFRRRTSPLNKEYEKVLTSDKYKVKGQYD